MMADPLIRLMGKSSRFVSLAFDWLNINLNEEMTLLLNSASQAQNRQQRRLAVVNAFEAKFTKIINQIKKVGVDIVASGQFEFNNPFWQNIIEQFLVFYYQRIPIEMYKNIISDLLVQGRNLSLEDASVITFRNSGPVFGKVLQAMSQEPGMGERLRGYRIKWQTRSPLYGARNNF